MWKIRQLHTDITEVTRVEVERTVSNLTDDKAAGSDEIVAEVVKEG